MSEVRELKPEWFELLLRLSEEYRQHEDESPKAVLLDAMRCLASPTVQAELPSSKPGDIQYLTPEQSEALGILRGFGR